MAETEGIDVRLTEWDIETLIELVSFETKAAASDDELPSAEKTELIHMYNNLANTLNLSLQRARLKKS